MQDFESQTPGESPKDWYSSWGKHGDDLLIVSNLQAAGGKQSLLLDRTGQLIEFGGWTTAFPGASEGWLQLSIAFRVEGAGSAAQFGIEIRAAVSDAGRRVLGLSFGECAVKTIPMNEAGTNASDKEAKPEVVGTFDRDVWYRIDVLLPSRSVGPAQGQVTLQRRKSPDGWEQVGTPVRCKIFPPAAGYGPLMLVPAPDSRGYKLFLDDIRTEQSAGPAR
ncbi:MAG: hypothetical protein NTW87_20145 [Planctomycetota bacterium]|nr:hypothetical protein [Planctomycetota bacterium]